MVDLVMVGGVLVEMILIGVVIKVELNVIYNVVIKLSSFEMG